MADNYFTRLLDRPRVRVAALVALVLVLGLGFQGSRGIWSPDEGYHTVIARTMLDTGEWLIPHVASQVWLEKPPLTHWAMAGGMWLLGNNEWGGRLSHALWYGLTALLVFLIGRGLWEERVGRVAALLYSTMLLPFVAANVLTPDTPLTFWTTASMGAFWYAWKGTGLQSERWKIVLGLTLALGVWTKGPAALIPTSAMLVFLVLSGSVVSFFLSWGLALGALVFLTIGLAWYFYVGATVPGALEYLWDNHVVGRLLSESYQRNPGLAGAAEVYLPVLVAGTLPASLVLWHTLRRRWRALLQRSFWGRLRRSPAELLAICWIAVPCAVLALASSKLTLYILPVFPAFALLFARLLLREAEARGASLSWLGLPRRLSRTFAVWVIALLALKAAGGVVGTDRDMRQVAAVLGDFVPPQPVEIVCVDLRCEGLAFYLGSAVERVTTADRAYPVFGGTVPLADELAELGEAANHHVIVYEGQAGNVVRTELQPYATLCPGAPILLPYDRRAVICTAAREVIRTIPPEPRKVAQLDPIAGSLAGVRRELRVKEP